MALRLRAPVVRDLGDVQLDLEQLAKVLEPDVVTALPAAPFDGQVINYLADAANGIVWRLKYRALSTSAYKWEVVGSPPPLVKFPGTGANQDVTSTSYANLTVRQQIVLPAGIGGDFDVEVGFSPWSATAGINVYLGYFVTGGASADVDAALIGVGTANTDQAGVMRPSRKTNVAAGATFELQARISAAGTGKLREPWMRVWPVRVG